MVICHTDFYRYSDSLIGVGVIKLIKNNQPDFVALTGIIVALGGSGVLAYGAEKLHAKMREKDRQILQNLSLIHI